MVYVLSGPVHAGKTTLLKKLISALKKNNIAVYGYLSLSLWEDQYLKGYDFYDLKSGNTFPFIRRKGHPEWEKIGSFFFRPTTLDKAKKIILNAGKKRGLCIVDEIGPLELSGKGVWPAVQKALAGKPSHMDFLFVIREGLLDEFKEIPGFEPDEVFPLQKESLLPIFLNLWD
mgnify:CR=1 FL=1